MIKAHLVAQAYRKVGDYDNSIKMDGPNLNFISKVIEVYQILDCIEQFQQTPTQWMTYERPFQKAKELAMDNFIEWQACDHWVTEYLPDGREQEVHITRKLICTHSKVDKVWFIGFMKRTPEDNTVGIRLEILMKDGHRESFNATKEQYESGVIPEAERFVALLVEEKTPTHLTEIKKELYRDKLAVAMFQRAIKGELRYICHRPNKPDLFFAVPFSDIGDGEFNSAIPAKFLIRYIVLPETTQP